MDPPQPLQQPDLARRNLAAIGRHLGPAADGLTAALTAALPGVADPDMALNNLERLLARPAARDYWPGMAADNGRGLGQVLQLLGASQFFADTLAAYPEALETVRTPPRYSPTAAELTQQLRADVDAAPDDAAALRAFRRFRHLQMLRIGVNDILRDRPLEEVTRELSRAADAAIEVALQTAQRAAAKKYGAPRGPGGAPARVAALAFGKLGGSELNYSSDIDLMFVYDADGQTEGKRAGRVSNQNFFEQCVREVVRLLSHPTDAGFAYRVDLRLRPEGQRGVLARSLASTLSYYDAMGRTWERQALIKLRPVAGDAELGREFAAAVEPFVYRKYFSFSEINEVKALKRRMEQAAARSGAGDADVKTGRGGIRDIEYTVQFLQLLNGGDLPAVRQRNTLLALDALEIAGCLTAQETYILADAYRFLRRAEHRLQLLFDWQTHRLPADVPGLRTLARRMGYREGGTRSFSPLSTLERGAGGVRLPSSPTSPDLTPQPPLQSGEGGQNRSLAPQRRSPLDEPPPGPALDPRALLVDPLDQFLQDLHEKTRLDRAILDHLLHQTFGAADAAAEPEADLILAPEPDADAVAAALGRYPFRDPAAAYGNLARMARESVPFLSHRRCRHFLASIAPQLLRAAAATPDPDLALNNLERVTASVGGKAVLYELFSSNPPTLRMAVEMCASSPYLVGILTSNPGMIDELLDSLLLDRPRGAAELKAELAELLRGAGDPDPILHSFQDKELLRVGVRDLLGRDGVRETTAALSDVAEALLDAACAAAEPAALAKAGLREAPPYAVLGLGKLGGREISYHSDLDLIVVHGGSGARFATELAQRVIKALSQAGPLGRLYAVDMRLRPTGKSGSLAVSLAEFARYFGGPSAQLWERQALTRARAVRGGAAFAGEVLAAARRAACGPAWTPEQGAEVRAMRDRLLKDASPRSLKRSPGGLVDAEFLVQKLQLQHGCERPGILVPNAWEALDALEAAGLLPAAEAAAVRAGYTFLREAEARLRFGTDRPLTELPEPAAERGKLARRLGLASADELAAELARHAAAVRAAFDRHVPG